MDGKGHPDEVLLANEDHVVGCWEKAILLVCQSLSRVRLFVSHEL